MVSAASKAAANKQSAESADKPKITRLAPLAAAEKRLAEVRERESVKALKQLDNKKDAVSRAKGQLDRWTRILAEAEEALAVAKHTAGIEDSEPNEAQAYADALEGVDASPADESDDQE